MSLDSPIPCHIDPGLKQSEIDGVSWVVFPDCDRCNPDLRVLRVEK